MMHDPSGRAYEDFVALLHTAIIRSDAIATHQNIVVRRDEIIKDASGTARRFDIYWEYELGGITHKTIIECKDHGRPLEIGEIDKVAGNMADFPGVRAAIATRSGYQSGAVTKAAARGIDLLIVREHNDADWDSLDDDFARVRFLSIEVVLDVPPRIVAFHPSVDGKWVRENTSIDTSEPLNINDLNTEIFIEDEGSPRRSLLDLASTMQAPEDGPEHGRFEETVPVDSGFLIHRGMRLKLVNYRVEYVISPPMREKIEIDIADHIMGVVVHLQKRSKKSVLNNGVIWDDELPNGSSSK